MAPAIFSVREACRARDVLNQTTMPDIAITSGIPITRLRHIEQAFTAREMISKRGAVALSTGAMSRTAASSTWTP